MEQNIYGELNKANHSVWFITVYSPRELLKLDASVEVANIHRVKRLAFVFGSGQVDAAVHVLADVACLDQVLDALASMSILVGVLCGGRELLL